MPHLYTRRSELTDSQRLWLSERLAELRGGMSIREFARRCELSEKTVRRIEAGDVDPSLGTLLAIVRGADLHSVEEVLTGRFGTASLRELGASEASGRAEAR